MSILAHAIYTSTKSYRCAIAHQMRNSSGFLPWKWGFFLSYSHFVLELNIEFVEWLILIHPYFLKTGSEPLKFGVFDSFCALVGILKNSPCFLHIVSGRDLLEFFIGYSTKQSIQCSTVKICSFDLYISRGWWLFRPCPTYFNCKPYFFI